MCRCGNLRIFHDLEENQAHNGTRINGLLSPHLAETKNKHA
jgi:hypothetical protein